MADTVEGVESIAIDIAFDDASDINIDVGSNELLHDVDEIITSRMAAGVLTLPVFPPALHAIRALTSQNPGADLTRLVAADPLAEVARDSRDRGDRGNRVRLAGVR